MGKRLAEKWVSLLVLPGALYLAVATAAVALGHTHPFDLSRVADRITAWASHSAATRGGGQVVLLVAVLAGAAVAGLAAQALGSLLERLWLAADWPAWPRPARRLAARRTARRRRAWIAAALTWHRRRDEDIRSLARRNPADPAARQAAERAMTRIAFEEPMRPTWSGDRLNAAAVRIERDQGLDLATVWPHLWLALPEGPRSEVTAARQALTRATHTGRLGPPLPAPHRPVVAGRPGRLRTRPHRSGPYARGRRRVCPVAGSRHPSARPRPGRTPEP
ncbi:hypothetical protein [Streptomyces sp. NPDC046727]|uniref:hypothetical protein n=1 Tax=Streptomyces sp. NPDC046727 TaxID=3155373 RepID=UPI0033E8109A